MKTCCQCHTPKDESEFYRRASSKDKLSSYCKPCEKGHQASYRASHKQERQQLNTNYYSKHRRRLCARQRKYKVNRLKIDPLFRLTETLRARVRNAMKGQNKSQATMKLVGCSPDALRSHLRDRFLPGMTWDNYGLFGWHVDHIRPCSSFDLSDPKEQEKCFNYSNLQPLWAKDNIKKGATPQAPLDTESPSE